MAGAVRIGNSGMVQVKVGVLQGIGPIGPTGVQGERGVQGEQGPQGVVGPMGQITKYQSQFAVGSANSLVSNTDTVMAFDSVLFDDLACRLSSTTYEPAVDGDFMLSCWIACSAPTGTADGTRDLWFTIEGVTVARVSCAAIAGVTYCNLMWPYRFVPSDTLQVKARSSDDATVGVAAGGLSIVRVGSGPPGIGLTGPAGPVGPAGALGPAGPPGSAGSGFATYADLL